MSALVCDICGGSLSMDGSGEFAVCDACGMKHSKERVRVKVQEVKGTVEVVTGMAEKERLLANAETFLKLGQYSKAGEAFRSVSEQFPDDYRGWWGVCKAMLLRVNAASNYQFHVDGMELYEQNMKHAYALCQKHAYALCQKHAYALCQDQEVYLPFFRELLAGFGGKIRTFSICPYGEKSSGYHSEGIDYYAHMDKNRKELEEITAAHPSLYFILALSDTICETCPLDELRQLVSTLCAEYEANVFSGEVAIHISVTSRGKRGPLFWTPVTKPMLERSEILTKKLTDNREVLTQLLSDYGAPGTIGVNDRIHYVFGPRIYYMYNPGWDGEAYYVCTLSQPIMEEMIDAAAYTMKHKLQQQRMQNRQCQHCGGEFKGLFNKSCVQCGKPKDY